MSQFTRNQSPVIAYRVPEDTGRKVGPNSEFTHFFKVVPGHAAELRDELKRFEGAVNASDAPLRVGLHESRATLFDNDTRMYFGTTFDGSINEYTDDAFHLVMPLLHAWGRHLEGYPGTMDKVADPEAYKKWFIGHFCKSSAYVRMYPRPLMEILNALKLSDAFQKVLDNPASHKLLQDPTLKPLLEFAAE